MDFCFYIACSIILKRFLKILQNKWPTWILDGIYIKMLLLHVSLLNWLSIARCILAWFSIWGNMWFIGSWKHIFFSTKILWNRCKCSCKLTLCWGKGDALMDRCYYANLLFDSNLAAVELSSSSVYVCFYWIQHYCLKV